MTHLDHEVDLRKLGRDIVINLVKFVVVGITLAFMFLAWHVCIFM